MDCMDKSFLFHFILQAILRLLNISVISLDLIVFFSRQNLPKQKMGCMSSILMTQKVKERIGFHYILTGIQPSTFIFLGLNIFLKKF